MNWVEIKVLTVGACVEAVAGVFHKYSSGGVAIEDWQSARTYENLQTWNDDFIPADIINHDYVVVKAYFPENFKQLPEIEESIRLVEEEIGYSCKIILGQVQDEDWQESWKSYYHTFRVGEKFVIKPSWEAYEPLQFDKVIELDPGMAFGTGIHASTRFCLQFIEKYINGGEFVIDAGCGSGILSIAAALVGANKILGVDIDEVAIKVAQENIEKNNLAEIINISLGDIYEVLDTHKPDVIIANIIAEVIVEILPKVAGSIKPGGLFFGSGIVEGRWPGVEQQLQNNGFTIIEVATDVDWVGVVARRDLD